MIEALRGHNQELQDAQAQAQARHDAQVSQLQEDLCSKEREIASSLKSLKSTEDQLQTSRKDLQALTEEHEAANESWRHESKRHAEELRP